MTSNIEPLAREMAERMERTYRKLFEARLLHHYWLDEGKTLFDSLPDEKQAQRLLHYDIGGFLEIAPTEQTEMTLKACRAFWSKTKTGFIVATSGETLIPAKMPLVRFDCSFMPRVPAPLGAAGMPTLE